MQTIFFFKNLFNGYLMFPYLLPLLGSLKSINFRSSVIFQFSVSEIKNIYLNVDQLLFFPFLATLKNADNTYASEMSIIHSVIEYSSLSLPDFLLSFGIIKKKKLSRCHLSLLLKKNVSKFLVSCTNYLF